MTTLNVQYKVGGETHAVDVVVDDRTTPRGIYMSCLKDYQLKTESSVKMPSYDDDNDQYVSSNVDLNVIYMPEFKNIECLKMYEEEEIMELF